MQASAPASLYLVTGFLGSGKTTVLNGILNSLGSRHIGVIVNEWGKIGVDSSLLRDPSGTGIVELPGGQIFCSCLSGSFIEAAVALAENGLDYVLVETSGLAKPSVLKDIVEEAQRRSDGKLRYCGMICVADATRYLTLRQVATAVDEQAAYSDRFVITKTDIADERTIAAVRDALLALKPAAEIYTVVNGAVDASILESGVGSIRTESPEFDSRFRGWGASGRPGTTSVVPEGPVALDRLKSFLTEIAPGSYRIKGFVRLSDDSVAGEGLVLVDCVGDEVAIRSIPLLNEHQIADGIAIVWKGVTPDPEGILRTWDRRIGVPARVL